MQEKFNNYVQSIDTYIMFRIKEAVARLTPELKAKDRAPISLAMGAPTQNPPQFVIDALKSALDEVGCHTYSNPKGEKFFLEACAKRMKERFGVDIDPASEICSLIGSKEGLANFARALINPAKEDKDKEIILIPDPGYATYKEMIKVSGGYPYSVPLKAEDNYMPDMEKILRKMVNEGFDIKKIKGLIINYPNNPLGVTATKAYLEEIVAFCKKYNILLMSDAAYSDMYFEENLKPMSIFEINGAKDIAVEFFSFSKPYAMTGWRIGWVCGNKEAIKYFAKLKSTIDNGILKPMQKAAAAILNSKEGNDYIIEANKMFRKRQQILVEGLKKLGWKNFNVPDTTFYLWLPVPPKYETATEFANDLLNKSGVVVVPGEGFGEYGKGFFRVSIVCSEEELYEVVRRMEEDGFFYTA
ncbi:MAG: aminotransferase class I/II-fold pyridoxal phosphate-dependent enzyme [Cyanobacteria bacterium SIG31]|nr:aminotransferase class I/II-fold pyridoxal phosphate-dependent enzyme [Cyanobacteria bacterium SIG31]